MNENIFEQALELCKDLDFFHRWLSKRDSQLLQSKYNAIVADIQANMFEISGNSDIAMLNNEKNNALDWSLEIVRKHLG